MLVVYLVVCIIAFSIPFMWFGNYFDTIKNEKKAKGKLVIDEDTIIKSLTYKLVEE